jgi:hypothetical protein
MSPPNRNKMSNEELIRNLKNRSLAMKKILEKLNDDQKKIKNNKNNKDEK